MTTEVIETQEIVVEIIAASELAKINATDAGLAELLETAKRLAATSVDSKEAYDEVHKLTMVAVKVRTESEKIAKRLAAPYKEKADAIISEGKRIGEKAREAESLVRPLKEAYEAERERIAHERAMFLQNRMEARVQQLRAWGFVWNANNDLYEWKEPTGDIGFFITFEDIKELDDDAYEPTRLLAEQCYTEHQAWLKQQAELAKRERERIEGEQKAEADRLAEIDRQQKAREAELRAAEERIRAQEQAIRDAEAKLEAERVAREKAEAERIAAENQNRNEERLSARVSRLSAIGFNEADKAMYNADYYLGHDQIAHVDDDVFDLFVQDVINANEKKAKDEASRKQAEADAVKAKIKADKDRQKRLAPEKEKLRIYLESAADLIDPKLKQPETIEFLAKFDESLSTLVNQYKALLESL